MIDFAKLAKSFAGSNSLVTGLAAGATGGMVAGALGNKKVRKLTKSAVKVGGLALVGGLAWKAYQSYQSNNANAPQTTAIDGSNDMNSVLPLREQDFAIEQTAPANLQMLIVQTMISAAMADGHIDNLESKRIFSEIDQMQLSDSERLSLLDEIRSPKSVEYIAGQVKDLAIAMEVYTAALLVIDNVRPEGARYLNKLADQLQIPDGLIQSLRQQTREVATASAA